MKKRKKIDFEEKDSFTLKLMVVNSHREVKAVKRKARDGARSSTKFGPTEEQSEYMIDHRNNTHNLNGVKFKPEENSGLNGIRTHDL